MKQATQKKLINYLKNKTIVVFGGSGSWGSELVRQLTTQYHPKEIRIVSRGEHRQVEMRAKYKKYKNLRYIIGDIRDKEVVDQGIFGADIVFNLAALKHVPVCEENVWESVQTNIHGAHNIVQSCQKHDVDVAIQVSTDKAVDPLNLYGFTKGCAEKLFTSANISHATGKTKFACVRGGNVLSTNGSVVPLFKHLIREHNTITITHKDMSRYIMRVEEAIHLVLKAVLETVGGEVFVMRMPGVRIVDLADVMIKQLGNKNTNISYIGLRPGEKMYEVLVSKNESYRTVKDGDYYVILPDRMFSDSALMKGYKNKKKIEFDEYNSLNTNQLNKKQILGLLEKDGWLSDLEKQQYEAVFSPKS